MRISTRGRIDAQPVAAGGTAPPARRRGRRVVVAALAALLALVVAVAGGLVWLAANADRIARQAVDGVSLAEEIALGELALAEARRRVRLGDAGPAAEALRVIGGRLTAGSRFRYRWYVGERPERNAFALPGGIVIVYAGLIDAAATPEELAGVIAHEVAHAELRHALRAAVQRLGLAGLVGLLLGGGGERFGAAIEAAGAGKFSRDAEREADRDAVARLVAARIAPDGLLTLYAKLDAAAAGAPGASHPATPERLAALRAEIDRRTAGAPPSEPIALDWAAVRAAVRP